jgi:hypothetical protein
MIRLTTTALLLTLLLLPRAWGQEPSGSRADSARQLAEQLTRTGAATFDTRNAQAMAAYYTAEAEICQTLKTEGGYETKSYVGRTEIESLYRDLFKGDPVIRSKNVVDNARLLQNDLLTISGTFEITKEGQTSRFPFFQIRVKRGDRWLISRLHIFILPENPS